jgi:hypothetical protein
VGCARVASQRTGFAKVLAEASSSNCFILGIFLRTDRHQTVISIVIKVLVMHIDVQDWDVQ